MAPDEHRRIMCKTLAFTEAVPNRYSRLGDILNYESIPIWDICGAYIYVVLLEIVKIIESTIRVIEIEKPDEILVFEDLGSFLFWNYVNHEILSKIDRSRIRGLSSIIKGIAESHGIMVKVAEPAIAAKLRYHIIRHALPVGVRALIKLREFQRGYKIPLRPHKRKRVVAILRGGHPALTAIPVIKELEKEFDIVAIAADGMLSDTAKKTLRNHCIEPVLYEQYLNEDVRRRIDSARKEMMERLHVLGGDNYFKESVRFGGVSLWPEVKDLFEYAFSLMFPEVIKYVEVAKEICKVEKPDLFLLMDDMTILERATAMVAKNQGIKTLVIQYGAVGEDLPHVHMVADNMAVWGSAVKDLLRKKRGVEPSKLIVTGSPGFEFRAEKIKSQARIKGNKRANSESKIPLVLFTSHPTQGNVDEARRLVDIYAFYRAAKKLRNLRFVVKVHPLESPDLHIRSKKQMGLEWVTVTKDADLYELMDSCDLLVSAFSTTVLEAIMLGKPVVIMNFTGEPDVIPFVKEGVAIGVYSPDTLPTSIETVLKDKEVRDHLAERAKGFLNAYLYRLDGKSALRVADVAKSMITSGS